MNAPLRALVCLLFVNSVGWSETRSATVVPLDVFLQAAPVESPELLVYLKAEVDQALQTAGYQVRWIPPQSSTEHVGLRSLALIKLKGVCAQPQPSETDHEVSPDAWLGSTVVNEGHVSPFMSVNCSLLGSVLAKRLETETSTRRVQLLGRAAGRVIAHEIYHMLADSLEHTPQGITKASFNSTDLLADELTFTHLALRRLTQPQLIARASTK